MILNFFIVLGAIFANINAQPDTSINLPIDQQQESSTSLERLQAEYELNEIDDYPKVIDVNGTIEEVEQILASNPDLPRLSRDEIRSILDNITSHDHNLSSTHNESQKEISSTEPTVNHISTQSSNTVQPENNKTQEEYMRAMRALMLVLPFNAKNLTYSEMKELYTKAPITRLVGERPGEVAQTTIHTTTNKPLTSIATTEHITSTSTEEQTKQYSNHHESYHHPYVSSSNYGSDHETTAILTTEQSTTTRRYKHRPNYPHRRRKPTTSTTTEQSTTETTDDNPPFFATQSQAQTTEQFHFPYQHYQTQPPEIYKNKLTTQMYHASKHVTTVYPERPVSYKTTEEYHRLSSVQSPITTVYPENTNTKESSTPNSYSESIKQKEQTLHSSENQSQHHNAFHLNRKRTKPPRSTTVTEPTSTTESTELGLDLPHEMKDVLENFEVDGHLSKVHVPLHDKPETTSLFITPTTEGSKILTASNPVNTKYSSQYSASEHVYDRVTTEKPIMRDDVKELLASIGLFPVKGSENVHTTTSTTKKPITVATTSTETPDIEAAAESFSPEMKYLLISFGLLPSANDIQHPSLQEEQKESIPLNYDKQAASPVIDPSSYLNFKPLPVTAEENPKEDEEWNSDMKQFLASFGLVPSASARAISGEEKISDQTEHSHRSQKSINIDNESIVNSTESSTDLDTAATMQIQNEKVPHINMDMLNDDMREVLENLGFFPSQESFDSQIKRKTNNEEGHIFNPSVHLASLNPTEEEAERLSKLLDTIKKLMKENGTISQEEIEALNASISFILPPVPAGNTTEAMQSTEDYTNIPLLFIPKKQDNKSTPLDKIKNAPDPLSLEELMSMMEEHKNEVKRQQPNNETTDTTTTPTTTIEESTKDKGPSLTDLADSFGGGETASADADVDAALPPKKPNGLYFLLDWNTFLQVEGEKRTVNLQFSPKLGDSRAFLPVSVP